MLGMPAAAAFLRHAPPDSESRLTIMITATPWLIMASQMVPNLALSPPAFWMLDLRPASVKALVRLGRSLASQRGEVVASGRITPTVLAVAPLLVLLPDEPLLLEPPQAASVSARAVAVTMGSTCHFLPDLIDHPFVVGGRRMRTITPYVVLPNIYRLRCVGSEPPRVSGDFIS